ncbi:preprotein translocase subunit YajC [Rhodococcus antarcticus]|jgi:preprotein translocase subunit YajC|uniref:Preprotein translocase subunit YajC n=1 Tax=Rhodococcus antarcticus TaxID=2987751 RepID=A0ABY6P4K4_9NOCA|nr:preprotein translocase subunit YajC [Rhodococcus antarcticus]UZJ26098.1 preprotein translocase subunit YajC [Rhodococcus antarcticus]
MNALLPILLVAFLGIMYMASRRQKKEAKAVSDMQDALTAGDEVMTTSGLHGTIVDLDEDTVDLEVAPGVVTTWNRLAIRSRVTVDASEDEVEDEDLEDDQVEDQPAVEAYEPAAPSLRKD